MAFPLDVQNVLLINVLGMTFSFEIVQTLYMFRGFYLKGEMLNLYSGFFTTETTKKVKVDKLAIELHCIALYLIEISLCLTG